MMDKEISFEEMCKHNRVLYERITRVKNWQLRKDLWLLSETSDECRREVTRELVNCRQQNRITQKYHLTLTQYYKSLEILEEYLVEAMIIDD